MEFKLTHFNQNIFRNRNELDRLSIGFYYPADMESIQEVGPGCEGYFAFACDPWGNSYMVEPQSDDPPVKFLDFDSGDITHVCDTVSEFMAWGIGGYFEKKGLHLGKLSPVMGITIRTFVALVLLAIISLPQWKTMPQAGPKAMLYLVLGGGVLAGCIGMTCFYVAIKGAPLSQVMPIAFTSPLFGALMGIVFNQEPISTKKVMGILLAVGGIVLLTTS